MSEQSKENPSTPAPGTPGSATSGDPVADRRKKLQRLREEFKIDPFGGRVEGLISLAAARAKYDKAADDATKVPVAAGAAAPPDNRPSVKVAGRVVLHRDIGKLVFLTVRDETGELQIGISKKSVDELSFNIAKLADLGDIVVASGKLGTTKTGELTVWAETSAGLGSGVSGLADQTQASPSSQTPDPRPQTPFTIASKSLEPPPEKFHGLTDPELRYRKRYVDLYANPQVMKLAQTRIRIVDEVRQFLRQRGYLEVETPMMQSLAGGAAARPFATHHNALDIPLFLRIAPELYLKRLLVGGFSKVFEINRNFRNEGISPKHNPEFTMLEAYEAFGSWETMAEMVESLICTVAQNVFGTLKIEHKNAEGVVTRTINLTRPWDRISMVDLVNKLVGIQFSKRAWNADEIDRIIAFAQALFVRRNKEKLELDKSEPFTPLNDFVRDGIPRHIKQELEKIDNPAEQLVYVYEKFIEQDLINPCFVTHVPGVVIPLAKRAAEPGVPEKDWYFADVYELAINGVEISPGYSELNDPDVQERHFRHQVGDREEQQKVDEDFLTALRVGMPPAGGMGLGIDRLVMMLTGAESIRDVILFPLMRPI